jgi:transmembrane sensor
LIDRGEKDLAAHVHTDLSDQRVERVWTGIAARLPRRRGRQRWLWAGGLATVAVAAVALLVRPLVRDRPTNARWTDTRLEASAQTQSLRLPDGSFLTVEPGTRVDTTAHDPADIRVALGQGRVLCDVPHRTGRSFVVLADDVEVRVVGTRFSVAREQSAGGNRVEVEVQRGAVEVRAGRSDRVARVEAGHAWSQTTRTGPLSEAPTPAPPPAAQPDAPALARPPAVDHPRPASPRAATAAADSRGLFEQARSLWRGGHIQEAADRYQDLLTQYPRDARAGLAAFELGRLRMDRLHDAPGAAEAFERAVALAPGAQLREDAMARLVAARSAAGDSASCRQVQARYLTAYPDGVHRRTVAAGCGAR